MNECMRKVFPTANIQSLTSGGFFFSCKRRFCRPQVNYTSFLEVVFVFEMDDLWSISVLIGAPALIGGKVWDYPILYNMDSVLLDSPFVHSMSCLYFQPPQLLKITHNKFCD